jgi:hypothetical protein
MWVEINLLRLAPARPDLIEGQVHLVDPRSANGCFWDVATIHEIDAMQRPTWRLHQRGALVALMPWSHYPRQRTFAMWRDGPQTTVADSSTEGFEFIPQLVG